MSIEQIFTDLGGYVAIAEATGVPASTASTWKTRESIPARYWPAIVKAAAERGRPDITFETLAGIAASTAASRKLRREAPARSQSEEGAAA